MDSTVIYGIAIYFSFVLIFAETWDTAETLVLVQAVLKLGIVIKKHCLIERRKLECG